LRACEGVPDFVGAGVVHLDFDVDCDDLFLQIGCSF
jgi:hypothetical protein